MVFHIFQGISVFDGVFQTEWKVFQRFSSTGDGVFHCVNALEYLLGKGSN